MSQTETSKNEMTEARRLEVVAIAKRLPKAEALPWVGRLWYNSRRFSWVIRFDGSPRQFDGRSHWEPIELVAA